LPKAWEDVVAMLDIEPSAGTELTGGMPQALASLPFFPPANVSALLTRIVPKLLGKGAFAVRTSLRDALTNLPPAIVVDQAPALVKLLKDGDFLARAQAFEVLHSLGGDVLAAHAADLVTIVGSAAFSWEEDRYEPARRLLRLVPPPPLLTPSSRRSPTRRGRPLATARRPSTRAAAGT
jgi:hypothetical protein